MSEEKKEVPAPRFRDCVCTACGHRFIGVGGGCPRCSGMSKAVPGGGEMTKKIMDNSDDLKKSF